jgi:calcineurin-like phosphoesterase family protein
LIRRWNETVGDDDTVWVLGDLGRKPHFRAVAMLKGEKRLVAGNGDDVAEIARTGLFAEIRAVKFLPGLLLTHVPVHPSQLDYRTSNVHGHLHARVIRSDRYVCVSVEQTDFRPISDDRVRARLFTQAGGRKRQLSAT